MAGRVRERQGAGLWPKPLWRFCLAGPFGARPTAYPIEASQIPLAGSDASEEGPEGRGPGSVASLDGDALLDREVDAEERPQRQPDGQRHDNRQQHGHNDLQVGGGVNAASL